MFGAIALAFAATWPILLRGRLTWLAATAITALGVCGGLFVSRLEICCMYNVSDRHGFPYPWLNKSAEYETLVNNAPPATFDNDATWWVDWPNLLLSGWFWASVALAALVLVRACILAVGHRKVSTGR